MTKTEKCIRLFSEEPLLTTEQVAIVVGCSIRTAQRAKDIVDSERVEEVITKTTSDKNPSVKTDKLKIEDLSNDTLQTLIVNLLRKYGATPVLVKLAVEFKQKMKIDEQKNRKINLDVFYKHESALYS